MPQAKCGLILPPFIAGREYADAGSLIRHVAGNGIARELFAPSYQTRALAERLTTAPVVVVGRGILEHQRFLALRARRFGISGG